MNNKLSKLLTIGVGLIGVVGFYFFIQILYYGSDAIENDAAVQAKTVAPFVTFAVAILVITGLIAIIASLVNMVRNPEVLKKTLIGVGLFGLLLLGAYIMADDGVIYDGVGKMLKDGEAGPTSKWVSTGINLSATLGVLGLIGFGADFVKSFLKN
ncbi:MAG: hypothetical protein JKY73_01745 [Lutibacter sp.]|nr:hypothetical protein [Lutibacter sp.]